MLKILIYGRYTEPWLERYKASFDVTTYDFMKMRKLLTADQIIEMLSDRDVLVLESAPLSASIIEQSPSLKVIAVCKGTVNNVDLEAATRQGILVINTPARNAEAVADLAVALIIMKSRHIFPACVKTKSGDWPKKSRMWAYLTFQGDELQGKVVGIVGFGAIGKLVTKRLQAFGMRVIAHDPFVNQEDASKLGVTLVPLSQLMSDADFVTLHAPVTPKTTGMISEQELALMKPTAYLINTSRAVVVDQIALLSVLEEHRIAGAALDVHYTEPLPADDPFLKLDNVLCTPHIGGATPQVVDHQLQMVLDDLLALQQGEIPKHVLNPTVLDVALKRIQEV